MERKCPRCHLSKSLDKFARIGSAKGHQAICTACSTALWEETIRKKKEANEKVRQDNPELWDKMVLATLYTNAAKRARKLGIPFTILRSDIPLVHTCPILLCSLRLHAGKQANDSYSLDRIDSTKGYVPGNVRVISWMANLTKNRLTLTEAERLVAYMKGTI